MSCIVGIFKFYMISYIKKKQSRENEENNSLKRKDLHKVKRGDSYMNGLCYLQSKGLVTAGVDLLLFPCVGQIRYSLCFLLFIL